MRQMPYKEFARRRDELDARLIDVRSPEEFREVHARGAELFPLSKLREGKRPEDDGRPIALICRSGNRSAMAAKILEADGFDECINIQDGTNGALEAGQEHIVSE
ncbi:MAG: rhodanese-like domain-containing protein [Bradymonadaceae bacterium]